MHLTDTLFSSKNKLGTILKTTTSQELINELVNKYSINAEIVDELTSDILHMSNTIFNNNSSIDFKHSQQSFNDHKLYDITNSIYESNVLASTNNLVNICDINTYEVLYLNKICKKLYNITNDSDYADKKCYELFYNADSPCEFCTSKLLKEKGTYSWKKYNPILNTYYLLTDQIIYIDGRELRLEVAVDIDKDTNYIKQLDNQIKLDETIFDCVKTLSMTDDLEQAITKMLEIVCNYHDGDRGYIFELNEDGTLLDNTYEWCRKGVTPEIKNLQNIPKESAKDWFVTFEKNGTFSISNLYENLDPNSPDYKILESQGIKSLIASPLIENNVIKGFMGVDDPRSEIDNFSLLTSVTYFVINDIQKRSFIAELERFSYYDTLTQLYNRNKYNRDLSSLESNLPDSLGVCFIDLNGLKVANDKFGHDYGDYMITQMAHILTEIFGENQNVYRIGGDEFVVLLPNILQEEFNKYVSILRKSVELGNEFTASVGTTWNAHNYTINNSIKHADDLMYADKQRYYQSLKIKDYNHSSLIAGQLISDIEDGRYMVYLQPKFSLNENTVCGAEALIRGTDIKGNITFPDTFIPIYESDGIIRHIDFFVLETVCKLINDLSKKGTSLGNISVNFSRITLLEHDVVKNMVEVCNRHNVNPSNITIEVTESTAKLQMEELVVLASKIKEAGFYISLDDYGTKYSNISMLSNIGFDEIKLDKSIVNEITFNEKTRTIIQYTIKMLKDLKMCKVVAEGIETLQELNIVKEYGCDLGQGYHFSRPIPIDEFLDTYFKDS